MQGSKSTDMSDLDLRFTLGDRKSGDATSGRQSLGLCAQLRFQTMFHLRDAFPLATGTERFLNPPALLQVATAGRILAMPPRPDAPAPGCASCNRALNVTEASRQYTPGRKCSDPSIRDSGARHPGLL